MGKEQWLSKQFLQYTISLVVYFVKPCPLFGRVYVAQAGFEITTLLIYFSSTGITNYTTTPNKTMGFISTTNLTHILSFLQSESHVAQASLEFAMQLSIILISDLFVFTSGLRLHFIKNLFKIFFLNHGQQNEVNNAYYSP